MKPEEVMAKLLPDVAAKCREHLKLMAYRGVSLVLTAGLRTSVEQVQEYKKGRVLTANGWVVVDPRLVVTHALPEQAPHCRGAAYDVVPIVNERAAWDRLDLFEAAGVVGESLGLIWGGRWPKLKDMPHFELPGWRALPVKEV